MVSNVSQQLGLIEQGSLRAARNTALGFVNTGNFKDFQKDSGKQIEKHSIIIIIICLKVIQHCKIFISI